MGAFIQQLQRTPRCRRLLANIASAQLLAGGLPEVVAAATYPNLDPIVPGEAPLQLLTAAGLASGIWAYRPDAREKVLPLSFFGVGADNETLTVDFGLFADLNVLHQEAEGKIARAVLTLGTRTLTARTYDPFTGDATFSSATLRRPDDVAWTFQDSDLQFLQKGVGANQNRLIYLDLTDTSLVLVAWQARSGTCSRLLVGMGTEGA